MGGYNLVRWDKQTQERCIATGETAVLQYMEDFSLKRKRTAMVHLFELYHDPKVVYIQNAAVAWLVECESGVSRPRVPIPARK